MGRRLGCRYASIACRGNELQGVGGKQLNVPAPHRCITPLTSQLSCAQIHTRKGPNACPVHTVLLPATTVVCHQRPCCPLCLRRAVKLALEKCREKYPELQREYQELAKIMEDRPREYYR